MTRLTFFAVGISGSAANTDSNNGLVVAGFPRANFTKSVAVETRTQDDSLFQIPVNFAGAQGDLPGLDEVVVSLIPDLQGVGSVALTLIVNGQRSSSRW